MNGTCGLNSWLRRGQFLVLTAAILAFAGPAAIAGPVTLFVADQTDDVVHRFDASTGAAILPDITLPSGAASVTGIAIGPGGDLFVAASSAAQVFRYNATTGVQIGGPFVTFNGQNDGHDVQGPEGMAFAPNGNLYVADVTLSNVHEYDASGGSVASLGADPSAFFSQPTDVAFDASGNLYVVNPGFADVLKSVGGTQTFAEFVSPLSGGLTIPQALTFGPDGKLYVLDASNSSGPAIRRYTASGADDGTVISYASTLFQPNDIAFGPDGKLYVSGLDLGIAAGQVLRYLPNGTPDGALVASGPSYPAFMAFSVPEPASITLLAMAGVWLLVTLRGRRAG